MEDSFDTRCIHGNKDAGPKDLYDALSFPIYQTASFFHKEPGHNASGFDYSRESNPTRTKLENVVASLENASDAIAFSSGMAAVSAVMALFSKGDEIICSVDLYGGVIRHHAVICEHSGNGIRYIDVSDTEELLRNINENTTGREHIHHKQSPLNVPKSINSNIDRRLFLNILLLMYQKCIFGTSGGD